jgi:hypothetical protein
MAYVKKHYRSIDKSTGRHQSRGGGLTKMTRSANPKRYATRPVEENFSPTFLAARKGRKMKV